MHYISSQPVPSFNLFSRVLGALALAWGTFAAARYWWAGLSLSHYDARGHLVVARRILDSITPSWEQIGAVWLPLPHVLNALPVQIDWMYRTGASGIAISVVSFAITVACLSAIVFRLTGSRTGGLVAALLFGLNPNVLYLQSTPMTEPLLFALTSLVILQLVSWCQASDARVPHATGFTIAAACLTRYEAWPIVGVAIVVAAWAKWRQGLPWRTTLASAARLTMYPAGAVLLFMGMSFATIGEWFVTGGFYVPDPKLQSDWRAVRQAIVEGVEELGGPRIATLTMISIVVLAIIGLLRKSRSGLLLPVALLASAALPFYAFMSGHPFRIRYEVPLLLGCAAVIGVATGLLRLLAPLAAIPILAGVIAQAPPFDQRAPMVVEAQLDRLNSLGRRAVTECLHRSYDGTTIMVSMGALAHYMQELSHAGFDLDDFLHEGSGPTWEFAYSRGPAAFTGWVLVEEAAEGGDMIYQKAKAWPGLLDGFQRVCEGGNVALYRRIARSSS